MAKKTKTKVSKNKTRERMASGDIIRMILEDHKPLKRLIKVLKNDDRSLQERQAAFKEFAPLLISHAKPEEESLYIAMKDMEKLRSEGFEGDVEHTLADQMVEEAKRTTDRDLWSAKVKVLAELVGHHIEEEEEDMLPDFKKCTESEERVQLGEKYRMLREDLLARGGEDTVRESKIRRREIAIHAAH